SAASASSSTNTVGMPSTRYPSSEKSGSPAPNSFSVGLLLVIASVAPRPPESSKPGCGLFASGLLGSVLGAGAGWLGSLGVPTGPTAASSYPGDWAVSPAPPSPSGVGSHSVQPIPEK